MGLFVKAKKDNKKADDKSDKLELDKKEVDDTKKDKVGMKDLYSNDGAAKDMADNKKASKKENSNAYKILVKPLITEKATNLSAENKYLFEVSMGSNKVEIKKAIQDVYGVEPEKINIIRSEGKKVRYGRSMGKKKDWKKAMVTLPKGKTINIYEGV